MKARLARVPARSVTRPRRRPPRAGAGWPWSLPPGHGGQDRPEAGSKPRQIGPSEQMLHLASAPRIKPNRAGSSTILAHMPGLPPLASCRHDEAVRLGPFNVTQGDIKLGLQAID